MHTHAYKEVGMGGGGGGGGPFNFLIGVAKPLNISLCDNGGGINTSLKNGLQKSQHGMVGFCN